MVVHNEWFNWIYLRLNPICSDCSTESVTQRDNQYNGHTLEFGLSFFDYIHFLWRNCCLLLQKQLDLIRRAKTCLIRVIHVLVSKHWLSLLEALILHFSSPKRWMVKWNGGIDIENGNDWWVIRDDLLGWVSIHSMAATIRLSTNSLANRLHSLTSRFYRRRAIGWSGRKATTTHIVCHFVVMTAWEGVLVISVSVCDVCQIKLIDRDISVSANRLLIRRCSKSVVLSGHRPVNVLLLRTRGSGADQIDLNGRSQLKASKQPESDSSHKTPKSGLQNGFTLFLC